MKRDGLLLLISTEENDWYISTHGYAIYAFTDDGISYIGKKPKPYLSGGDFAGAFDAFATILSLRQETKCPIIRSIFRRNPFRGSGYPFRL